jgi:hypothetical protein
VAARFLLPFSISLPLSPHQSKGVFSLRKFLVLATVTLSFVFIN